MMPSLAGAAVAAALMLLGLRLGSPLVVALLASLAFGATAIVSLGGSSPLIFTVFALLILAATAARQHVLGALLDTLKRHWLPSVLLGFLVYAVIGSFLLPRLFFSATTAFVPIMGEITEMPLAPTNGNITQTSYVAIGVLTCLALTVNLRLGMPIAVLGRAFMALAAIQAGLGLIDIAGKLVGVADVLAPIRTATYSMLSDTQVGGFWRISGGFSEASGYAAMGVACLAYSFTYWREYGGRAPLALSLLLAGLLLLSTSTTAYVSLALVSLPLLCSVTYSILLSRIRKRDLVLAAFAFIGITAIGVVQASNENLLTPFVDLVNSMVFEKHASSSGIERAYWNAKSLQAFQDTGWLGIGLGSSRSSSWAVSVLSQLGALGAAAMAVIVGFLAGSLGIARRTLNAHDFAIARSARAAALASLVTMTISGASADPGMLFFVALSIPLSAELRAARAHRPANIGFATIRV